MKQEPDHSFALGAISVSGTDAPAFLDAQFGARVVTEPGAAQFTAWHNPKGRVLVTLFVLARADDWLLLMHPSLEATTLRRLQLFVLRSQVQLNSRGKLLVRPAAGYTGDDRFSAAGLDLRLTGDSVKGGGFSDAAAAAFIAAGVPLIDANQSERHLPQSLNLDLLGGVAFDKGCFPGQEVIARTQNLGRIKRRLFAFESGAPRPETGAFLINGNKDKRGETILAVSRGDVSNILATVELRALAEPLYLSGDEQPLVLKPLPYAVPQNAA